MSEMVTVSKKDIRLLIEHADDRGGYGSAAWQARLRLAAALETEGHEPDNERGVWCCDDHRQEFFERHPSLRGRK